MRKSITASCVCVLAFAVVQACAHDTTVPLPTLDALQGAWWFDCQDPAAEFVIDGSEYYGDFLGQFQLELNGDVLVLKDGLIDGHSTDVTHEPLSFHVISVTSERLLLRPMSASPQVHDWELFSCEGMPPNNAMQRSSLVGTPLAGTRTGADGLRSASGAPTARRR